MVRDRYNLLSDCPKFCIRLHELIGGLLLDKRLLQEITTMYANLNLCCNNRCCIKIWSVNDRLHHQELISHPLDGIFHYLSALLLAPSFYKPRPNGNRLPLRIDIFQNGEWYRGKENSLLFLMGKFPLSISSITYSSYENLMSGVVKQRNCCAEKFGMLYKPMEYSGPIEDLQATLFVKTGIHCLKSSRTKLCIEL